MAPYRIFTQASDGRIDVVRLLTQARTFFEASVEVLGAEEHSVRLKLESPRRGYQGTFSVRTRAATPADYEAADRAEASGRAAGMAALARRCPQIWEVEPEPASAEAATLNLCALLASVALGPVLPPDGRTLFGVRGAMERVERSSNGRSLLR